MNPESITARPSPPPGFITRAYRSVAGAAGAGFTALFVVLAIWLLLAAPSSIGGAGWGEGGGRGSGMGGGIGDGRGPGTGGGEGDGFGDRGGRGADGAMHGDASPADDLDDLDDPLDATDSGSAAASAAPSDGAADESLRRPPRRVGFTAVREAEAPPEAPAPKEPVKTADGTRPGAGAGGGGGGGGGGDGAPSFMGVSGRGNRVVYVIDRSGSMNADQRFAHARYELKRSIRSLAEEGEFFVIYFDTTALPMPSEKLVRATRANVERFSKWIDQQQTGGGTNPTDAMAQALALGPDTIFLLSDGVFEDEVAGRIRAANTRRCSISTIAFHDPSGEAVLQRIARENEGSYRFVPPP